MLSNKLSLLSSYKKAYIVPIRNLQISLLGAASDIGSNVALLLKQNDAIDKLRLHDDNPKVIGIGMELTHIPGGPAVEAFSGENQLNSSIDNSDLIVMTSDCQSHQGNTDDQMLASNALSVHRAIIAISETNPDVLLAVAVKPLNSILPLVSGLLFKHHCYNPYKVFGITEIDSARSRSFAARLLQTAPQNLQIPVVGGSSDKTVLPLFSNLQPASIAVDVCQSDMLTRMVRKCSAEAVNQPQGYETETLAMSWSINEFVAGITRAFGGETVELHCFCANPNISTRYFAGPAAIDSSGIVNVCGEFSMNDMEKHLMRCLVPVLSKDVDIGERFLRKFERLGLYQTKHL